MKPLQTALRHIRRAPYQAIAAISTCMLTFTIAAIFIMVALGSSQILKFFETRPEVTVFFKDEASPNQIFSVKEKLEKTGITASVRYISKEEALEIYREENKSDPLLLEMVTANILPASLEISAHDPALLKTIAEMVKSEPIVEEVLFQEDIISSLTKWTNAIRITGITLGLAFAFQTFTIFLIIIGMKISLKREEIEILNLIGASKWDIKAPFIYEGIIYGLTGGFLSWVFAVTALLYATPFLVSFLAGLPVLPVPLWFYPLLLGGILAAGFILGSLGSLVAVRRFLK